MTNRNYYKTFTAVGVILTLALFGLLIPLIISLVQQQRYQMASCTINDKTLNSIPSAKGGGSSSSASFTFTVHAVGQPYVASGYDNGLSNSGTDDASQQAIFDHYTIGQTYPCWYDPSHPDQVVLVRGSVLSLINWITGGGLLLAGIFLLLGILGLRGNLAK